VWQHRLRVERVLPPDHGLRLARCLGGLGACQPEDVSGAWANLHFLGAIRHPKHPGHNEYLEWIGEGFDPLAFDLDGINEIPRSPR